MDPKFEFGSIYICTSVSRLNQEEDHHDCLARKYIFIICNPLVECIN